MLSWFRSPPCCPVSPVQKEWLERRFGWLIEEFGLGFLQSVKQVLPTTEYFPAHYERTEEEIHSILKTVADYLDVDAATLRLRYYRGVDPHSFLEPSTEEGIFDICLDETMLDDPLVLVSVIASEIAHVILVGQKRANPEEADLVMLDELLIVYYGLGIIAANSVMRGTAFRSGRSAFWERQQHEQLSMNMYGYALALFALMREEPQPSWKSYLRPDVHASFDQSIRYIKETGDCSLEIPGSFS